VRPPLVIDEWPDRVFGRPVARLLVRLLAKTSMTANQCTALAAGVGIAAGLFLGLGWGWAAAAAILVFLVLDCADGQLARMGRGGGIFGRVVDGIGDYVTAIALHAGLMVWIGRQTGNALDGAVWAVAAAVSMAWSAFLLDRYKRRYRGDVDDLDAVRREVERATGLRRRLLKVFLPYAARASHRSEIPDRAAYQERVRVPMVLWLQQGPTVHLVALAVCAALERPGLYAWIAVLPFNAVAIATLLLQRALEAREPSVVTAAAPTE
jgi:phosphatidylglycerophosphate synthase